MTTILDIPPEILAASFEIGIYTWDVGFLHPLSQVCSAWRDLIENTPRLWGIIILGKCAKRNAPKLKKQLEKAKEAPLSIILQKGRTVQEHRRLVDQLVKLSHNWAMAQMGTDFLALSRWSILRHCLGELELRRYNLAESEEFFQDDENPHLLNQPSKLHSFTANCLPRSWVVGFLSPSIRHFGLNSGHNSVGPDRYQARMQNLRDTWDYLRRIPNATSIELGQLAHRTLIRDPPPTTHLQNLRKLRLGDVLYPSSVLSTIAAPNLQTLTIDGKHPNDSRLWGVRVEQDGQLLAPFFAQWTQPQFVPTHLHTLELRQCVEESDVPYLIRWLERLPNLVRLFLTDDTIAEAARHEGSAPEGEDRNVYRALSRPRMQDNGMVGWLCPLLMILVLDTDQEVSDVIPIARARGGRSVPLPTLPEGIPNPGRLRRVETILCSGGKTEVEELKSLVDTTYCICMDCGLMVEDDGSEEVLLEL